MGSYDVPGALRNHRKYLRVLMWRWRGRRVPAADHGYAAPRAHSRCECGARRTSSRPRSNRRYRPANHPHRYHAASDACVPLPQTDCESLAFRRSANMITECCSMLSRIRVRLIIEYACSGVQNSSNLHLRFDAFDGDGSADRHVARNPHSLLVFRSSSDPD